MMTVTQHTACLESFKAHDRDRSMFQREFCRRLLAEPELKGKVLDIGCGGGLPPALAPIQAVMRDVDGVDPTPAVLNHPLLNRKVHAEFEKCELPTGEYDMAYAYNVVEHIEAAEPFFRELRRVLKPGGVFWALTPHGRHPFSYCVRFIQALNVKRRMAARNNAVNDYMAYYRLNTPRLIARVAEQCGFKSLELVFMPCPQWDMYFAKPFRGIPHLYDRLLGMHYPRFMQILAYRLQ